MADFRCSQATYCQGIWIEGEEYAMEERLMKPKELAERLGTSMDWVYRHWKELPFTVKLSPRQLRFSEKGLEQYLEGKQDVRSSENELGARTKP
jgi:predicted DNA-binding transcriptional regulator AlpA